MSGIGWPMQGTVTDDGGLGWPVAEDALELSEQLARLERLEPLGQPERPAKAETPSNGEQPEPPGEESVMVWPDGNRNRGFALDGAVWWDALQDDDVPTIVTGTEQTPAQIDPRVPASVDVASVPDRSGNLSEQAAVLHHQIDVRGQEWGGPAAPTPALVGELRRATAPGGSPGTSSSVPSLAGFHVERAAPAPTPAPAPVPDAAPGRWGRWRDSVDEAPGALFRADDDPRQQPGTAGQEPAPSAVNGTTSDQPMEGTPGTAGTTARPEWVPDGSSAGTRSWRDLGANAPSPARPGEGISAAPPGPSAEEAFSPGVERPAAWGPGAVSGGALAEPADAAVGVAAMIDVSRETESEGTVMQSRLSDSAGVASSQLSGSTQELRAAPGAESGEGLLAGLGPALETTCGSAVSRETDTLDAEVKAGDLARSVAPAWEDQSTGAVLTTDPTEIRHDPRGDAPAGQTAPAESPDPEAPGPIDGSAGSTERTGDAEHPIAETALSESQEQMSEYGHMMTTGPTPMLGYQEHERVDLVRSLPTVDDSTPLAVEVAEDARRRITLSGRPFPKPPHTRIMTVANQKGGVGKTTTTVNVAAALAQAGLNVLVLDIDPQGNASTALGIDHHSDIPSLYDVVVEGMPMAEVVQPCPDVQNLWCAPATIDLAGAEIELVSLVARETRLQRALATYLEERIEAGLPNIDYVFVDCPPSLSLLTVNAFVAAREVLIPIQCEYYALEGLSQLLKHVELIRGHLNPQLHVSTILLTMYDGRTRLSSQVAEEVREHFPDQVVKTSVPRSVRISEAPSHGQTVMTYDPASSGALSYLEAARELAEQVLTWTDRPTTNEERV